MATQTTYFEFNKPAGTDLVNPLVDTNPNWDLADAALHELDERSVANATETVVLGVHAISRLDTYTKFIKWIATANFTAGDTFTVDGNVVAASTPAGVALATGAYVTGSVVLACLNADDSAMTIFVSGTNVATDSERLGGELPSYYATQSDMTGAETDIDNLQALAGSTSIASIADGTLTGAVYELNDSLTAEQEDMSNLFNWEQIANSTSATAETNITVSSLSQYRALAFCQNESNLYLYAPTIVPMSVFTQGYHFGCFYKTPEYYASFTYVDSTHIKVKSVGYGYRIYGVK